MFGNGNLARQLEGIRAALVADFRVQRGEKCVGEFRQIYVGPLHGALPKNEISDERQRNQHDCKHGGVPKWEPAANRIKNCFSGGRPWPWRDPWPNHFGPPPPPPRN